MADVTSDLKQAITNVAAQVVKQMRQTHGLDVTLDVKETAKSITVTVKKVEDYVEPEPEPLIEAEIERDVEPTDLGDSPTNYPKSSE